MTQLGHIELEIFLASIHNFSFRGKLALKSIGKLS